MAISPRLVRAKDTTSIIPTANEILNIFSLIIITAFYFDRSYRKQRELITPNEFPDI